MQLILIPSYQGALDKSNGLELGPKTILNNYRRIYGPSSLSKVKIIEMAAADFDDITLQFSKNYNKILKLIKKGNVYIGGDHSITYLLFRAVKKKYPNCALLVLDCHSDMHVLFDFVSHQDWLYYLIKEKIVSNKDLMLYGLRDFSRQEKKFIKDKKIEVLSHSKSVGSKVNSVIDFCRKHKQVYVSFDIDAISPIYAPGTGYRKNGGLTPDFAYKLLSLIKENSDLVGFDLVEVNPKLDKNNKTLDVASKIVNLIIK